MPAGIPPTHCPGRPEQELLPAGTALWRVHNKKRPASVFSPVPAHLFFGGGRFDSTEKDEYGYVYLGTQPRTALSERYLRSLPYSETGTRVLPRAGLKNRRLSKVEVTSRLRLLPLVTADDLRAICQDEWLVTADGPTTYPLTRHWGHYLRRRHPWAQGFVWESLRDRPERALVLFADRCPDDVLKPVSGDFTDLEDPSSADWLSATLQVRVYRPRVR
ncbi:RES family NAD+ phosphorylase [Flindersiella endophytica]